jgi:pimeloyl-ACP methyl ester carboxylesterase
MTAEPGRGWSGSLRRRVAHEIRLHRTENRAMRRTRYSLAERSVRAVLAGHSFGWFVGTYVALALAVVLALSVSGGTRNLIAGVIAATQGGEVLY